MYSWASGSAQWQSDCLACTRPWVPSPALEQHKHCWEYIHIICVIKASLQCSRNPNPGCSPAFGMFHQHGSQGHSSQLPALEPERSGSDPPLFETGPPAAEAVPEEGPVSHCCSQPLKYYTADNITTSSRGLWSTKCHTATILGAAKASPPSDLQTWQVLSLLEEINSTRWE